jgi:hypothetical protein
MTHTLIRVSEPGEERAMDLKSSNDTSPETDLRASHISAYLCEWMVTAM